MKKPYLRTMIITCLFATLAIYLPVAAYASSDTGWTKSRNLYEVRTWAGQEQWGDADGVLTEATLFHPHSIVELPSGDLLIADKSNHLLRRIAKSELTTFSGLTLGVDEARLPIGSYHDDKLSLAAYAHPSGLAVDTEGTVYVADSGNHAVRKIAIDGTVTTLAGNGLNGHVDAQGAAASFDTPTDVAVDGKGNVYVADTLNHVIRKITSDGTVTTLNAPSDRIVEYFDGVVSNTGDYADGEISKAKFNEPSGLVVDARGNLYISDRGNQRIRYMDFKSNKVTTVAGGPASTIVAPIYAPEGLYAEGDYIDGSVDAARFNAPEGLALTTDGSLIVADSLNHVIRMIKEGQVTTLTGVANEFGQADGVTYEAQFNHPTDVAVLSDGRLAISDEYGNKIRILGKYSGSSETAADHIRIVLNGTQLATGVAPLIKAGAVLLPIRSVGNALGYEAAFEQKAKTGVLKKAEVKFKLAAGNKTALKLVGATQTKVVLNSAPILNNGSMYVPVRFFAAEMNLDVQWDASNKTVVLRNKKF